MLPDMLVGHYAADPRRQNLVSQKTLIPAVT